MADDPTPEQTRVRQPREVQNANGLPTALWRHGTLGNPQWNDNGAPTDIMWNDNGEPLFVAQLPVVDPRES
jgi:hypothetical protein